MDIYLDDYHLHSTSQTLQTTVKRPIEGLENPEQRLDVYDNPGSDGQTVGNILNGSSLITMQGSLKAIAGGTDQAKQLEYESARDDLINAVRTRRDADDRPVPFTLKFTMPSGEMYQATVYKQSALKFPMEYLTYGQWTLHLLNPRGVIESQTETTATVYLPQGSGLKFPVRFSLHFGASSGGAGTVTNNGTAVAKPVITFYGPMINPVLYNDTLGVFVGFNITLDSEDIIVVRPATPSAVQGTLSTTPTTPVMGSLTTGSNVGKMVIAPGANSFTLRAASYDTGRVEIVYRDTREGK